MYKRFDKYLGSRYLPRWFVFLFDLIVVIFSYILSYILMSNANLNVMRFGTVIGQLILIIPVYILGFVIFKPYNEIIRHAGTKDIRQILLALTISSTLQLLLVLIAQNLQINPLFLTPYSVIILNFIISIFIITWLRLFVKFIYQNIRLYNKKEVRVMIMGADELGQLALTALEKSVNPTYNIIGFIDDNEQLQGKAKGSVPIYSLSKAFDSLIKTHQIDEMVIAVKRGLIFEERVKKLMDVCLQNKIIIKELPSVNGWLGGRLNARQLRQMNISDLLGREVIKLDTDRIREGLTSSVILVTGGAGSIGSELVKQLLHFGAKKVIIVDQAESSLYDLQNELLLKHYPKDKFSSVIADITNLTRMLQIFERYRPDIVFNAAAYKHVPLMEENPKEAILVNVGGTQILTKLSIQFKVKKFVMISTDKAVNPTNVMGASKRICEMYVQAQSQNEGIKTQFITTRFGNVLDSNGSVVPLFSKQISEGGPITLTDKGITRYFMTISEACQLVLEAGFMGSGGEIYIFDMGKPVRIYDLAVKMITLAGLEPERDIEIKVTGLRPGEKLYEELLANKENTLPTYHEKIMIGKTRKVSPVEIHNSVHALLNLLEYGSDFELVNLMKEIVPEYISQNSVFEELDVVRLYQNKQ